MNGGQMQARFSAPVWLHCNFCIARPSPDNNLAFFVSSCQHIVCGNCASTWPQNSNVCPSCRAWVVLVEVSQLPQPLLTKVTAFLPDLNTVIKVISFQSRQSEHLIRCLMKEKAKLEAAIKKNRQRSEFIKEEISYIKALSLERKKAKMFRKPMPSPPTPKMSPINLDETAVSAVSPQLNYLISPASNFTVTPNIDPRPSKPFNLYQNYPFNPQLNASFNPVLNDSLRPQPGSPFQRLQNLSFSSLKSYPQRTFSVRPQLNSSFQPDQSYPFNPRKSSHPFNPRLNSSLNVQPSYSFNQQPYQTYSSSFGRSIQGSRLSFQSNMDLS